MAEVGGMDIFEGPPEKVVFSYNLVALEARRYYTAGRLTAWSLAHNGPGPRNFNRALFLKMCGQAVDLPAEDIMQLLEEGQAEKFRQVMYM